MNGMANRNQAEGGAVVRNLPAAQGTRETQVQPLEDEYHLEEDMATYPSILAWEIP